MNEERNDITAMLAAIRASGVTDPRILSAFERIPRDRFVPQENRALAHADRALPIGEGQTISQPSMVALMLAALEPQPHERALEVGAGSGYAAALLSRLVAEVDAIEIRPELAERAKATLADLGIDNVRVHVANGRDGLADRAPFDVILVSAGARGLPPTLVEELAPGGRIAIPVGSDDEQRLVVGHRQGRGPVRFQSRLRCTFVPLVEAAP